MRGEVRPREHIGEVTDEHREGCEGPYLLQHVRVHEYVVVGARACDGIEGVLHVRGDERGVDPTLAPVERQGNDANAGAREIETVPVAEPAKIYLLVRDERDIELVLQDRGERRHV